MQSLRIKLAVGVAVLGAAGVGTAAIAHDRSKFSTGLSGYEEVPALSTLRPTASSGLGQPRPERAPVFAQLPRPVRRQRGGRDRDPGAHPSWRACGQRRHLGVPVQQSRQRAGGHAGVPARRHGERHDHAGAGGRTGRPGHRGEQFGELVQAMRAGVTYANIHTTTFGGGEIRGQIGDDDDRDH